MKHYSDCNDTEKYIINEYASWIKSNAPLNYKIAMAQKYRLRANDLGISHLLTRV